MVKKRKLTALKDQITCIFCRMRGVKSFWLYCILSLWSGEKIFWSFRAVNFLFLTSVFIFFLFCHIRDRLLICMVIFFYLRNKQIQTDPSTHPFIEKMFWSFRAVNFLFLTTVFIFFLFCHIRDRPLICMVIFSICVTSKYRLTHPPTHLLTLRK